MAFEGHSAKWSLFRSAAPERDNSREDATLPEFNEKCFAAFVVHDSL
jgi:hypothetical protein